MKVLHAVRPFLRISENWIYPQVMDVPGVKPAILCDERVNSDQFPAPHAHFIYDPPPWSESSGVPRLLNSIAFRLGARGLFANAAIARWNPDLIHAHFGMTGSDLLPVSRKLDIPLVTSFYGVDAWRVSEAREAALHDLFNQGAAFIAEGPAMAARLAEIGCPESRIHVCRIGVKVSQLSFWPAAPQAELRVVMMARFVPKKGFSDGLRACAEAAASGRKLAVTIIGDASPGDKEGAAIREELQAIEQDTALRGRVNFAGFQSLADARDLLYQHDVFLVPSLHAPDGDAEGGAPVGLTEAMAMGLLCLGTRHCDIPETIQDGVTGFLADSSDISGMADLLCQVADEPDRFSSIRQAGRQRIEQYFSREQQVTALAQIYRSACRTQQPGIATASPQPIETSPKEAPLVTIGIPCFNAEIWITQAVQSALDQTHPNLQIIVVDDGSSDRSVEHLKAFGDRIELVQQDHAGGNRARNEILQRARGEWLQYLDADDYLMPGKIARQLAEADAEADVLYSQVVVEEHGEQSLSLLDPSLDLYSRWITWQLPQTGGCLWKRASLQVLGGWNEAMACCQEHELYLRALQADLTFVHTPSSLAVYRIWSQETVCRRDPRQLLTIRTELIERMVEWLKATGRWTETHAAETGRIFFEMSRGLAQQDLAEASRFHRERKASGSIRLSGKAAPLPYRLAYHLLGFPAAERIARVRRT